MSSIPTPRTGQRDARRSEPAGGGPPCSVCAGSGTLTGADLGAFGMVEDDGSPILMACLACEGTGVEPALARGDA